MACARPHEFEGEFQPSVAILADMQTWVPIFLWLGRPRGALYGELGSVMERWKREFSTFGRARRESSAGVLGTRIDFSGAILRIRIGIDGRSLVRRHDFASRKAFPSALLGFGRPMDRPPSPYAGG